MDNVLGIIDVMPENGTEKAIQEAIDKKQFYDELTKENEEPKILKQIYKESFDELIKELL